MAVDGEDGARAAVDHGLDEVALDGEPVVAVVGVGINVNNPAQGFPGSLRETAISLIEVTGERQDLGQVLEAVLGGIEAALEEERCRSSR